MAPDLRKLARSLRQRQTDVEQMLWRRLRDRQALGLKFRRQHPIGNYIVDFCCVEKRLIVELDGGQHACDIQADELRTRRLTEKGYRVLRFWNNELIENMDGVLERIIEATHEPSPLPSPFGKPSERERVKVGKLDESVTAIKSLVSSYYKRSPIVWTEHIDESIAERRARGPG